MLLSLVNYILLVICVLISVAFFNFIWTEVAWLYIQIRKGPNKVGPIGILQPFADAIKLFTKEGAFPFSSNFIPYYLCPVFALFLSLGVWLVCPSFWGVCDFSLGCLFILSFIAISVYTITGSGWFSNSKYALLGALCSVAQTISYEVCLAMLIIMIVMCVFSYDLNVLLEWQEYFLMITLFLPLSFIWILIMLAETNRTPFDFAEGESELVSGFNVEYGSGGFALIFMAEYSSILFMSCIYVLLFVGMGGFFLGFSIALVSFLFIWIRGLLSRFRYDKLMYLAWSSLLPFVLNYFILVYGVLMLM